jgi:pilus retraction protein PilT
MAELDIAEKRVPQDGRFKLRMPGKTIDFRVSIMPSVHGEDAVIRILDKESISEQFTELRLDILGFPELELKRFRKYIAEPYGMVLVTGPTGSGKTTTLYAALSEIKSIEDKIITIEDPVEYQIPGVNQTQINEKIKLTFSSALRSILRQDPDVILVGEMRDFETIETGLLAAETGHLVFSTLHTLDATETINRIIAVFPPHQQKQIRLQLASVLRAVVSQRLMPNPRGDGRVPAVEVLTSTAFIRDCIADREKTHLIHGAIAQGTSQYGMQTFDQSIFSLYERGLVQLEEALRWASNVDDFKLKVQGISNTAEMARDQMAGVGAGRKPEITRFG